MSLLGVAWLTCMQMWQDQGCLEIFQQDAILRYGHLGHVKCRKVQKALELFGQMQHQCMHQSSSLLLLTSCNLEGEFWRNMAFCYDLEASVSFEKKGTCFQNCCFLWFSHMGFFAEASPMQIFVSNHPICPQKMLCPCLVCICNQTYWWFYDFRFCVHAWSLLSISKLVESFIIVDQLRM